MKLKTKKADYHHGDLRSALIEESISLLRSHGVEGLSLRLLARKLGVSHTAPYRHFKSREDLIVTIATEGLETLKEEVLLAISRHSELSRETVLDAIMAYHQFAQKNPERFFLIFNILSHRILDLDQYPAFKKTIRKYFKELFKFISKAQEKELIAPGESSFVAFTIWSLVHGISMLSLSNFLDTISLKVPWKKDVNGHLSEFLMNAQKHYCPN